MINRHTIQIRKIIYTALCSTDGDFREDVEQEVLLSLYRNLNQFRFRSSFSTWLYRICRNKALDMVKKERRNKSNQDLSLQLPSDENLENDYLKKERKEKLFQALSRLKEKERIIIVLKDLEDLPLNEVSAILKIPVGTVKSRLNRSRKKLETILKESFDET